MRKPSNKRMNVLLALVLCVTMLAGFGASAQAVSPTPTSTPTATPPAADTGTLTINPTYGGQLVSNAGTFDLYKVASADDKGVNVSYTLTSDFAGCGVDIASLGDIDADVSADKVRAATSALITYLNANSATMTPTYASVSSETATDVELGVYLVVHRTVRAGYNRTAPFLAFVPMAERATGEWNYDVTASPKLTVPSPDPTTPPPTSTTTPPPTGTDTETSTTPPDEDLDENDIPRGDFTDPNNPDVEEEFELEDNEVPLGPAPNTGMLQWPIPVLSVLGVLLIAAGLLSGRKKEENEEV